MKKIIVALLSVACMTVFCSCGSPLDCSICELNFQLPSGFTMETDQKVANDELNEALGVTEDNEDDQLTSEDFRAVQLYYGDEYDIGVTALEYPYNNNELKEGLEGIVDDYGGDDEVFAASSDGTQGIHGVSEVDETTSNYYFSILHNGLLYDITYYNHPDLSDEEISDLINSISFDDSALKKRTVECGDISIKIHGEYQPLTIEDEEEYKDYQAFGRFGDSRTEFTVLYIDEYVEGPSERLDFMTEEYPDAEYAKVDESFATCYYASAETESGYEVVCAFEHGDNIYFLSLLNEDDPVTIKDLQKITQTIKVE